MSATFKHSKIYRPFFRATFSKRKGGKAPEGFRKQWIYFWRATVCTPRPNWSRRSVAHKSGFIYGNEGERMLQVISTIADKGKSEYLIKLLGKGYKREKKHLIYPWKRSPLNSREIAVLDVWMWRSKNNANEHYVSLQWIIKLP